MNIIDRDPATVYMHTSSGSKYYPMAPRAEDVQIEVIAHHLASKCRYSGAVQHPTRPDLILYGVGEHSVYVRNDVLDQGFPEFELEALLHDAAEAYIGDIIRPLKYAPAIYEPFKQIEVLNEQIIAERFNLIYPFPAQIKLADEAVTAKECATIVPMERGDDWRVGKLHDDSRQYKGVILMLDPYSAKMAFMNAFTSALGRRVKYRELTPYMRTFLDK